MASAWATCSACSPSSMLPGDLFGQQHDARQPDQQEKHVDDDLAACLDVLHLLLVGRQILDEIAAMAQHLGKHEGAVEEDGKQAGEDQLRRERKCRAPVASV